MRRVCVFELYVRFENGRRSHHIAIADLAVHNGNDRACVCMCLECLCYEILLCVRFLRLLGCFYFCCFAYFFYISLSFSPSLRPPLAYFPSNNSLGWETVLEFFLLLHSFVRFIANLHVFSKKALERGELASFPSYRLFQSYFWPTHIHSFRF